MLKRVNELKSALKNLNGKVHPDNDNMWALHAGKLMNMLESTQNAVTPAMFVSIMRQVYPMFDDKDEHGHYRQ